jgi:urease accessory protein
MTTIYQVHERVIHTHEPVIDQVMLDSDTREKGRFKTISRAGVEVRVFLARGKPLIIGEYLKSDCGKLIEIIGTEEAVGEATCDNWLVFSRACYHLGNRHVKLEVGDRWLRIKPDHVLEEMLIGLGLDICHNNQVFIPESGAYAGNHNHH